MPVTSAPDANLIAVILHFEYSEWDAIKAAAQEGSPLDYIHDTVMHRLAEDAYVTAHINAHLAQSRAALDE